MRPDQISLVQETWKQVEPIAAVAADLFYDRLLKLDETLRPLFKDTDMSAQKARLIQALSFTVACLDAPEALVPTLKDLGRRHVTYGVVGDHYDLVGAALLWTLEQGLGEAWSPAVEAAWTAAYGLVSQTMQAGAADAPNGVGRRLKAAA